MESTRTVSNAGPLVAAWAQSMALAGLLGYNLHGCVAPMAPPMEQPKKVDAVPPPPTVRSAFFDLGKAYGPTLAAAYGEAWLMGADRLDGAKNVDEALRAVKEDWETRRTEEFTKTVAPAFERVAPDGKLEPEFRNALKKAWHEFGRGLKNPPP